MRQRIHRFKQGVFSVVLGLAIVLGGLVSLAPDTASAQMRGRVYDRMNRHHRGRVIVTHRFFNMHRRHFRHNRYFRYEYPRRIILVNRFTGGQIILRNYRTGPYSRNINVVRIFVNDNFFERARYFHDIDQDIDIDVNTGNNTISLNTIVGNISTGDVDIDVR